MFGLECADVSTDDVGWTGTSYLLLLSQWLVISVVIRPIVAAALRNGTRTPYHLALTETHNLNEMPHEHHFNLLVLRTRRACTRASVPHNMTSTVSRSTTTWSA